MAERIEAENLRQIERLNQRGGRTLSCIDLIAAGTFSLEIAGLCAAAIARGASMLTGAVPGGAGKTTLMASLLGFLAPGRPIATVESADDLSTSCADNEAVYLVHEIGSGPWYGYLWGPAVADYMALARGPGSIATCLHADTVDETLGILSSPPLGARPQDLDHIGLMLFINRSGGHHRVTTACVPAAGGGHGRLFEWDRWSGSHLRMGGEDVLSPLCELLNTSRAELAELSDGMEKLLGDLLVSEVNRYEDVRQAFVESGLK